jgi:hypothetical protein
MKKLKAQTMKEESILLKDLQDLLTNKSKYKVSEQEGYQGVRNIDYEGQQGEYNEKFIYYKHPKLPENVFMKETYITDSYGNDYSLFSVEFVQGKSKTITVYEPI